MKRSLATAFGALMVLAGVAGPAYAGPPQAGSPPGGIAQAGVVLAEAGRTGRVHAGFAHAADAYGGGYLRTRTESYGTDPLQKVTVARWSTDSGPRPVVYFVHGGSWVMGTPDRWSHDAKVWAERGWTTINVSYRLGVDGRLMLADLRTVTEKYRTMPYVDPQRQILVGDSAGAQLATLLAARYPARFKGVVAWSPVVSPDAAIATGAAPGATPEQVLLGRRAQQVWGFTHRTNTALSYVNATTPPLWVAASQNEWVPYSVQGGPLCQALGARCHATIVPGTDHGVRLSSAEPVLGDESLAWAEATVN